MTHDDFLKKRGLLVETGLTHDQLAVMMIRTDGRCVCQSCGKKYREHPYATEARNWDGEVYLHVICGGMIVKL